MSLTIKNNEYLIKIPCSCRRMRSVCVAIHLYAGLAAIALLRLRVLCRALSRGSAAAAAVVRNCEKERRENIPFSSSRITAILYINLPTFALVSL